MELAGVEPETLNDTLIDKLAGVKVESLDLTLMRVEARTLRATLVDREAVEVKELGVILVGVKAETLFDKIAEVEIELIGVKLMDVEAGTLSSTVLNKLKK